LKKKKVFLKVDKVKKYYGETGALKKVDLEVSEGEWVTIMGPSGSGKTTLLSILGGLIKPTEGKVRIDGENITEFLERDLARFRREKVGFIFQQHHLIPYLTALENVMMAQFLHSMPDEKEAIEALRKVGLEHRLRHLPAQLSGGEQQRVGIARALINSPVLLLADEPTGNLDRKNARLVLDMLKKLRKEEKFTVVLVTHDPWVAQWGERTVLLEDGKVVGEKKGGKVVRGI
jgi:putative ABC transport system ATP-binding protein